MRCLRTPYDHAMYKSQTKTCSLPHCNEPLYAKGLCGLHYDRQRRGQDPTAPKHTGRGGTKLDHFLKYVKKTETCWLWTGVLTAEGYGPNNGVGSPHRRAYELFVGPIPEGHEIDHTCNVRHCVNPEHLDAVTNTENIRRSVERRTTCRNGHDRSLSRITTGKQVCTVCERAAQRRYRAKKALA